VVFLVIWADYLEESDNLTLVNDMFKALKERDYDKFLSYFDGKLIFIKPSGKIINKLRLMEFYKNIDDVFQDSSYEIQRMFVNNQTVVVDTLWSGVHVGKYDGIEPSGEHFELPCVWILDFMQDKVITAKKVVDNLQLLQLSNKSRFNNIK
jgi:ketosteroid isomerase-like protein